MAKITVSIAAYNDAESIGALVDEAAAATSQLTSDYEIWVIEDGGSDSTLEVVQVMASTRPWLKVIAHERNLGFGPTIREAYTSPGGDWVFFLPGDGQVPPGEILKLQPFTDNYDFILAARSERHDHVFRRLNSWVYNRLVSMAAGRRIGDVNGAGLLRVGVLKPELLKSQSAFIHAEILLELLRTGGRCHEVPTTHLPRRFGTASGNRIRVILSTIRDLGLYVLDRRLGIRLGARR